MKLKGGARAGRMLKSIPISSNVRGSSVDPRVSHASGNVYASADLISLKELSHVSILLSSTDGSAMFTLNVLFCPPKRG